MRDGDRGGAEQEQELQQAAVAIGFRSRVVGVAGSDAVVWSTTNQLDATASLETARCKSMLTSLVNRNRFVHARINASLQVKFPCFVFLKMEASGQISPGLHSRGPDKLRIFPHAMENDKLAPQN